MKIYKGVNEERIQVVLRRVVVEKGKRKIKTLKTASFTINEVEGISIQYIRDLFIRAIEREEHEMRDIRKDLEEEEQRLRSMEKDSEERGSKTTR